MSSDKQLQCVDCDSTFLFSAEEQIFFRDKGLVNEPKRCVDCRLKARYKRGGHTINFHDALCARCESKTVVPFQPNEVKPVFCRACLNVVVLKDPEVFQAELKAREALQSA